ncbi:MAG: HlyD family secretion protein, partial [Planctomycetia bacterium]
MATISRELDTDRAAPPPRRLVRRRTFADLVTQWLLPVVALGLLGFAGWFVWRSRPQTTNPAPPVAPAVNPYADALAAAGIVEAQTENIAVGSATPGVVVEVLVKVGDDVKPGAPLFRLDDRELRAELAVRAAAVDRSKSDLVRLEAEPRPEKIPVLAAMVREAEALLARERDVLKRSQETFAQRVTTAEDLVTKQQAVAYAEAGLAKARADLDLLEAGSWQYDRDVSRADLKRSEAEAGKIETELDRLVVRALVAGRVLQVNVRPGEFVGTPANQPLVIL